MCTTEPSHRPQPHADKRRVDAGALDELADELKEMVSGAGFLEVERETVFFGSAQMLTGVRGPLTPVGGGRE